MVRDMLSAGGDDEGRVGGFVAGRVFKPFGLRYVSFKPLCQVQASGGGADLETHVKGSFFVSVAGGWRGALLVFLKACTVPRGL